MLGVDLCKTKHFRISELTTELCFHSMQILDFCRRESQAFGFIVSLEVVDKLNGGRLEVDGENLLVQTLIHALQHGVVLCSGISHGKILLDARNAVQVHVLRNFNGIGAPRSNHFTARTYEKSVKRLAFHQFGFAIKPTEFAHFVSGEHMVHLCGDDALLRGFEE